MPLSEALRCRVAQPQLAHEVQESAGAFAAIDLGLNGCRAWPTAMHLTSPVNFFAAYQFPAAFTVDVASTGLQPGLDSPDWTNLLTVEGFRPTDVRVAYPELHYFYGPSGALTHGFSILPASQQPDLPPTASIVGQQVIVF